MRRCMFVDDSSVIRKVAKRILGGPELILIEASTGHEAYRMCEADMPDVIIVDAGLPDTSADDLIRRIRAIRSPIIPQVAICLTEVDVPAIMRAKRAGASTFILKPFNRAQLLERFRSLNVPSQAA